MGKKHKELDPIDERKLDIMTNGDKMEKNIARHRELEKHLVSMRLTPTMVILVKPDKNTPEYRDKALKRYNITTR